MCKQFIFPKGQLAGCISFFIPDAIVCWTGDSKKYPPIMRRSSAMIKPDLSLYIHNASRF